MTTPAGTESASKRNVSDPDVVTAGVIVLAALGTLVLLRVVFRGALNG